jgi:hypothetical protein
MSIALVIAGVERTNYVAPASVSFSHMLGSRSTATLRLVVPNADFNPEVGQTMAIYEEGLNVFGGTIDAKDLKRLATGGWNITLSCVSHEQHLDKRMIPIAVYQNQTAGAIVTDIITKYAQGDELFLGDIRDGATVSKIVYDYTRISQALDDLAQLSGYIWYVTPTNLLNFVPRDTYDAPFALDNSFTLWTDNLLLRQTREDFRDVQYIRVSFSAFAPYIEYLDGDGVTQNFNVSLLVNRVDSITLSTAIRSSVVGTLSGIPFDGESITINGIVYFWKSVLDNSLANGVHIGSTVAQCLANLYAAINDTGLNKSFAYSGATVAHPNCSAAAPSGSTITVRYKVGGTVGDGTPVSDSTASFSWAASSMSGGVDGTVTVVDFGIENLDTDKAWYYSIGQTTIKQRATDAPLDVGTFLEVIYRPLGYDVMALQDDAVIDQRRIVENGSGVYEHIIDDSRNTDAKGALAKAQAVLDTYKNIPEWLEYETYERGLRVGQLQTINISNPPVNGRYLIQTLDAQSDGKRFKYKVKGLDGTRIGTWLKFWEQLALVGTGSSGSSINVSGGAGSTGAGKSNDWVQESPHGPKNGSNAVFTLTWVPQTSRLTGLQIVILTKNGVQLTPFVYSSEGYATLGGDYTLAGNLLTLAVAPNADDFLVAEYFPLILGPVGAPVSGALHISFSYFQAVTANGPQPSVIPYWRTLTAHVGPHPPYYDASNTNAVSQTGVSSLVGASPPPHDGLTIPVPADNVAGGVSISGDRVCNLDFTRTFDVDLEADLQTLYVICSTPGTLFWINSSGALDSELQVWNVYATKTYANGFVEVYFPSKCSIDTPGAGRGTASAANFRADVTDHTSSGLSQEPGIAFWDFKKAIPATTIRMNCGGLDYIDAGGNLWLADKSYNGAANTSAHTISGTTEQYLYQTAQVSNADPTPLKYSFNEAIGNYTVKLRFAETVMTAAGQRVFNIDVNGTAVSGFDIWAAAGAADTLYELDLSVVVTAGVLNITLTPVTSHAMISTIEIVPA